MNGSQDPEENGEFDVHIQIPARKGSDPLISTARGKLQSKRSKLNDEINRELRMRNGAENLYRATDNKRLKELVSVELLFFNSSIQLLKEEVSDLNSSVHVYQHDGASAVPMIPLGLKETKDVDFTNSIKDFILAHYSEDCEVYSAEIQDLHELRAALRTPQRNEAGLELLTEYYNQLYFLEKRFFPPDRRLGILFHWYDSLTGVPNIQKTFTFEKGCVLFNIGSLYTQLACKQDRAIREGLRQAVRYFELAGGSFRYLHNHFSHAPSMDMQPQSLTMLVQLMMSQAQECVYESLTLLGVSPGILNFFCAAQEAAMVSHMYRDTQELMSTKPVKEYIPYSWLSMAQVKVEYYHALAHHHVADALLDQPDSIDLQKVKLLIAGLFWKEESGEERSVKLPRTFHERKELAKAHLREALICHEEALRLHGLCRQLRKIDHFNNILRRAHERSISKFSSLEEEDDFSEIFTAPHIRASSHQVVAPMNPEFTKVKVQELFHKLMMNSADPDQPVHPGSTLVTKPISSISPATMTFQGPVSIFNARNEWSAPRTVVLDRHPDQGFGFSVRGDCPVKVADIEPGSIAEAGNINVGDYIFAVGNANTRSSKHDEVVNLVRKSGGHLVLRVITPMNLDQDSLGVPSTPSTPGTPMRMQSPELCVSGVSGKSSKSRLSASWIFAKKGSKDKDTDDSVKSKDSDDGEMFLN